MLVSVETRKATQRVAVRATAARVAQGAPLPGPGARGGAALLYFWWSAVDLSDYPIESD